MNDALTTALIAAALARSTSSTETARPSPSSASRAGSRTAPLAGTAYHFSPTDRAHRCLDARDGVVRPADHPAIWREAA